MMYTEEAYQQCIKKDRQTLFGVLAPFVCLFTVMIVSFALRWGRVYTIALSVVSFALLAYGMLVFWAPARRYKNHVDHALHGRTRQTEGVLVGLEQEAVTKEGLSYYPFMINVGEQRLPKDDRLFYYDARLPRPAWQEGQKLRVTSYDNRVVDWEIVEEN